MIQIRKYKKERTYKGSTCGVGDIYIDLTAKVYEFNFRYQIKKDSEFKVLKYSSYRNSSTGYDMWCIAQGNYLGV